MSFLATFSISDHKYNVINASFEITQKLGHRNRPVADKELGLIHVELESNNKLELFSWALGGATKAKGEIIFYRKDTNAALKTLEFDDAYCVGYEELFEGDGKIPMRVKIKIAARTITFYGVGASEEWSGFKSEDQTKHKTPQNAKGSAEEVVSFNPNSD